MDYSQNPLNREQFEVSWGFVEGARFQFAFTGSHLGQVLQELDQYPSGETLDVCEMRIHHWAGQAFIKNWPDHRFLNAIRYCIRYLLQRIDDLREEIRLSSLDLKVSCA